MNNAGTTPPDGWYPDPGSPAVQLRYWRAGAWTEHVHPLDLSAAATGPAGGFRDLPADGNVSDATGGRATPAPGAKKRRRGLVLGIVGGSTAVAVAAAAFFVWGAPQVWGPQITTQDGWAYAYAPMQNNLEIDHEFSFPADYDLKSLARANGDERDTSFAFDVFTDAALTRHGELRAYQPDPGADIDISPRSIGTYEYDPNLGVFGKQPRREFEINNTSIWGIQDTFYLVQKLDKSGQPLEKPIVHPFRVKTSLAAPQVNYATNDNGTLQMSWDAVPGATEYVIVTTWWEGADRYTKVIGATEDTGWSPPVVNPFSGEEVEAELEQNDGLEMYRTSAAALAANTETGAVDALNNDASQYEYGVLATDGTRFSAARTTDAMSVAAALPRTVDAYTNAQQFPNGQRVDSLEEIPTRFFFTSLDGATRQTAARIIPESLKVEDDHIYMQLSGIGTGLARTLYLNTTDLGQAQAQVAAFTERVAAELPPTGLPTVTMVSAPIQADLGQYTPSTEAPEVAYPISATNSFTDYLAANLIDHQEAISIAGWEERPGMPALDDAIGEAVYQNPYVLGYRGYSLIDDVVYVSYANDAEQTARLQAAVKASVDQAVGSVTTPGMGAAEKAAALNGWLADKAVYDKAALEAGEGGVGFPSGFPHAWDASGVLLDENSATGVCASYAAAYKALMDAAGVPTVVVTGNVFSGGGHAWNKVQVDGQWLAVDPTWNDGADQKKYLLISDSQFSGSAAREEGKDWMADQRLADYATP